MSYINDALAKAQVEKDHRYLQFDGAGQTSPPVRAFRFKHPIMVAVAVLCVVMLSWPMYLLWQTHYGKQRLLVKAPVNRPAPMAARNPSPDVTRIYMDALHHQRSGDYVIAEVLYKQVLTLDPDHPYALNNLGVLYMIQKMPDKALLLFQRAVTLKGDYVHPYYNLACIYAKQQRGAESLRYLKQAIALKPDINEWAAVDGDLKNLRDNPDFRKLIKKRAS